MEEEAHVRDDDVVGIGKQFAGWMVAEFSGSEGVETTDSADESALFGEFFIDEGSDGSEGYQPSSLNEVHLLE